MKPYADSNFLVRLYLQLPETPVAAQWAATGHEQGTGLFPLTWLHRVEVSNAFQLHVFLSRSGRLPRVSAELAASAHATFRQDASSGEWFDGVSLELTSVGRQVEELLLRHTAKHGFRAYDLLHVAQALLLGCDTFLSFDQKANKLAQFEGLKLLKH
jgi:predicted nucleic acid-binding protein